MNKNDKYDKIHEKVGVIAMEIKDTKNNFELIVASSLRYGLGRRTYITSVIPEFIIENMDILSDKIKKSMIEDIKDQERWRIWRWLRQEKLNGFIGEIRKKYKKMKLRKYQKNLQKNIEKMIKSLYNEYNSSRYLISAIIKMWVATLLAK